MILKAFKVADLRKCYFPKLGIYENVWGLRIRDVKVHSFRIDRYNKITYLDNEMQPTYIFQDTCYLDD